jgi:hypothetical protein
MRGEKMKQTLICITIFFTFLIASLNAQGTESEEYIVEKYDTLWDISDRRLEDPFLWPKLWNVNPHIDNPDLIYPGTKVIIPSREELMRMPAFPEKKTPSVRKLKVRERKSVKSEAKQTFVFTPDTKQKYIVDKDLYIASGWISDEFPSVGELKYSPMNRDIVGKGDIVYLNLNNDVAPEKRFYAIRDMKIVKHPVSGKKIGHQIRVLGILEVTGTVKNMLEAKVTASYEDIQMGDGLLPYHELEPPLIPETSRTPDIEGYIIETHMNNYIIGEKDIVFLDKGENDGLEIGDVFSVIFSDVFSELKKGRAPARTVGKIQIVSLQPKTSGAVLLESSGEITIGTKWEQKEN